MNALLKFQIEHQISSEIHLSSFGAIQFTENSFVKSIFGPSGCGKTTLLKIFLGIVQPASSLIQFKNENWQKDNLAVPTYKRRIGFVPQRECLFPFLNVEENLVYSLHNDDRAARLGELVRLFKIENLLKRQVSELSGGQRQRVSLARAVANRPQLLLLDEAFSALDVGSRERLLPDLSDWLHELKIPCIVVSHDEGDARLLSSEIFHFDGHCFNV